MAITIFTALLTLGSIARMTRGVVEDSITAPLRASVLRKSRTSRAWHWLGVLIECTWCASFWVSMAFTTGFYAWKTRQDPTDWSLSTWFEWAVSFPAASYVVGIAASWLDAPPPPRQHDVSPLHITLHDKRR